MANDKLILRTLSSPFTYPNPDNTKNSVLSWEDVDNNFIFLKGRSISGLTYANDTITIKLTDGTTYPAVITGISSDTFVTGGTVIADTLMLYRNDNVVITIDLNSDDLYWTSGSSGNYSIKAKNDSGLDAIANYSIAQGYGTLANGMASHAEGSATTVNGNASHGEGYNTTTVGDFSHSEGEITLSYGKSSHSEGYKTTAQGDYSHTEGTYTIANGSYSHTEGSYTTAQGNYSHAEGYTTTSVGTNSHAEGYNSRTIGDYSHSENFNTSAIGNHSHAEGITTTAQGLASHSEGMFTTAIGQYSHAEGYMSIASGDTSHVIGRNNFAGGNYSFVGGYYNYLTSEANNSAILGGSQITGSSPNTMYVGYINLTTPGGVPSNSGDTSGEIGAIRWDGDYLYIKTNKNGGAWGRIMLNYNF